MKTFYHHSPNLWLKLPSGLAPAALVSRFAKLSPAFARWASVLLLWCASALVPLASIGQTVICPKEYINGFKEEHDFAASLLPGNVIGRPKMQVFVMKKEEYLYIQSNYRPSEEFEYPIKIATKDSRDLREIHRNIYSCAGQASPDFDVVKAYEKDASFIFDESVINERGEIDLDIGPKISDDVYALVDGTPPPKRLRKIKSNDVPPTWMVEYEPSIHAKIKAGFNPGKVLDKLREVPFQKTDMQLVSLFMETAVETKLANSSIKGLAAKLDAISEAEIEKVFATSQAKIIVLFGHASEDAFVTRSPDNRKTLLHLSFAKVKALAEKYQKDVIYLGCNSFQASALGADHAFNPLVALKQLEEAVKADNLHDFLSTFSSEKLGIVMDETAFTNSIDGNATADAAGDAAGMDTEVGTSSFKIVRKSRLAGRQADSYDIGEEVGRVRFEFGHRLQVPTKPASDSASAIVTPSVSGDTPAPGPGENGGSPTGMLPKKETSWGLWGVLLAMGGLGVFLLIATLNPKSKS